MEDLLDECDGVGAIGLYCLDTQLGDRPMRHLVDNRPRGRLERLFLLRRERPIPPPRFLNFG
jgi:hypothetical protein